MLSTNGVHLSKNDSSLLLAGRSNSTNKTLIKVRFHSHELDLRCLPVGVLLFFVQTEGSLEPSDGIEESWVECSEFVVVGKNLESAWISIASPDIVKLCRQEKLTRFLSMWNKHTKSSRQPNLVKCFSSSMKKTNVVKWPN